MWTTYSVIRKQLLIVFLKGLIDTVVEVGGDSGIRTC